MYIFLAEICFKFDIFINRMLTKNGSYSNHKLGKMKPIQFGSTCIMTQPTTNRYVRSVQFSSTCIRIKSIIQFFK